MSTVDALQGTTAASATEAGQQSRAFDTEDFLKIMLTELTNQDPFEPVSNQDLLNQMSTIQQLQSSEKTTAAFEGITDQFGAFMGQMDQFLNREQMSSAAQMVGQMVTATNESGETVMGKVAGIRLNGADVLLELDTGESVPMENITWLGGADSSELVGSLVVGPAGEDGALTVGVVTSMEVSGDEVLLHLTSGETVNLSSSTVITPDTVHYLLGRFVEGGDNVAGFVESYRIEGGGVEGITLQLDTGEELALTSITNILSNLG